MKNISTIASLFFVFLTSNVFSQFTYSPVDTIEYGAPNTNAGAELVCYANLYNSTPNAIPMRVTREKNVMSDAPNWTSAFCMDLCYLDGTDSVNFLFNPMDTVFFVLHIKIENEPNPDSATVIMRWRNTNTPSNSFTKLFYGITQAGFGIHELSDHSAQVSMYPMPAVSGEVFSMDVSGSLSNNAMSVVVYNMFGARVKEIDHVLNGTNLMSLDLPGGVYSYNLLSNNQVINSGKLAIIK